MIRTATADDLALARELLNEFEREFPEPEWRDDSSAEDLAELEQAVADGRVLLADDVAIAVTAKRGERVEFLDLLYVRPQVRRRGLGTELVREVIGRARDRGADTLELDVLASNAEARSLYERWGFSPLELTLAAPLERLLGRLKEAPRGPTFGSIHVQTDDTGKVERAVYKVLPRLGHSAGTAVTGPRNGWVAVHDELVDREPHSLQRLAKELSYTIGGVALAIGVEEGALVTYTLYDRGGCVDEYSSVPEYRGALPPGDVVALGANPTVVARLTGADPARVRAVARTAASPSELPPALELVGQIAGVMGIAEATHGWEG